MTERRNLELINSRSDDEAYIYDHGKKETIFVGSKSEAEAEFRRLNDLNEKDRK